MITYSNIVRHDNLPFQDYLKLEGYSFSFLKREINGINPHLEITNNIRLGSMVDAILTEPEKVDYSDPIYKPAKEIAALIRSKYSSLLFAFQKQVSFTAIANFGGFEMPVTGRLDYLLIDHAVIDLKVTMSKDIHALIQFMKYDNQLWNYCKMAKVDKAYLMIHSVPLKKTELIALNCADNMNEFWADKILKFGKAKESIAA
jgi:hypothetical protein